MLPEDLTKWSWWCKEIVVVKVVIIPSKLKKTRVMKDFYYKWQWWNVYHFLLKGDTLRLWILHIFVELFSTIFTTALHCRFNCLRLHNFFTAPFKNTVLNTLTVRNTLFEHNIAHCVIKICNKYFVLPQGGANITNFSNTT